MAVRVSNITAQALTVPGEHLRSVTDNITFVQEPFRRTIRVANITTQVLQAGNLVAVRSNTDNLNLLQNLFFFLAIDDVKIVTDNLGLQQSAFPGLFTVPSDNIAFTDVASVSGVDIRTINQPMGLTHGSSGQLGVPHLPIPITDDLSLSDLLERCVEITVPTDIMSLSDIGFRLFAPSDALGLSQTVSGGIGAPLQTDIINFTQNVALSNDFLRSASHTNIVSDAFTYYIDNPCNRKMYARFEGSGGEAGIPEGFLEFDAVFTLESATGPKNILVLRSPENDDRDRLAFTRVNRETRGGELRVFSDQGWPKVNTLVFTIIALKKQKIESLLQFMQDTLGEEIKLHDWSGRSWQGIITTPGDVAVEDRAGWWTISFEFDGVAFDGQAPDNRLVLSDSAIFSGDWTRTESDPIILSEDTIQGGPKPVGPSSDFSLNLGHTASAVVESP